MNAQPVDSSEVTPAKAREHLEGWIPELAEPAAIRDALEKAFDFRGDVSITKRDGAVVNGYVFDRRTGQTLADSFVRIMPAGSKEKQNIAYSDIARIIFDRRDPAAGKSWEAWVRKYWEKKAAGETNIQIEPESLDER
ncbi:MAG TPA: hypothetical protein VHZ07_21350 [Bryobacteraceae bacterium]|jgi:hypothetical protein|nr:hypothetical protein [Bryobacteraceae bacterium]